MTLSNTKNNTKSNNTNSNSNTGMKKSSSNNLLTKYMDLKEASKTAIVNLNVNPHP